MSINGPLDLGPWRDRLIAQVPTLRQVGLAADLAAVKKAPRNPPEAFVVPVTDSPVARAGAGNSLISQNVNATIAVVTVFSNARGSATGSAATADVQAVRRAVLTALMGWLPPGAAFAIQYAGGAAVNYEDSAVWVSDRFTTAYFLKSEITS